MALDRSTLRPGNQVLGFSRTAGLRNSNRSGAATSEFVDILMDDTAGRQAGYYRAAGMGTPTIVWFFAMFGQGLDAGAPVLLRQIDPPVEERHCHVLGHRKQITEGDSITRVHLELHAEPAGRRMAQSSARPRRSKGSRRCRPACRWCSPSTDLEAFVEPGSVWHGLPG